MAKELLADYPLTAERYDEMLAAPLEPRAHWKPLLESLAAERAERMRERLQAVQRQVRENGVTYNVYADPQGADRPWELDLLPYTSIRMRLSSVARCAIAASIAAHSCGAMMSGRRSSSQGRSAPCGSA